MLNNVPRYVRTFIPGNAAIFVAVVVILGLTLAGQGTAADIVFFIGLALALVLLIVTWSSIEPRIATSPTPDSEICSGLRRGESRHGICGSTEGAGSSSKENDERIK